MAQTTEINLRVRSNVPEVTDDVKDLNKELDNTTDAVENIDESLDGGKWDKFASSAKKALDKTKKASEQVAKNFENIHEGLDVSEQALSSLGDGMEAVGLQTEELEATMAKVEGVMQFQEGIQGLAEAGKNIVSFGKKGVGAMKGLKVAIASTGIGLLVVALGTLVAYWDDIMSAVSGVSAEQEEQYELAVATAEADQQRLDSISEQENILKLQGKSEREIVELKLKATDQAIASLKIAINEAELRKKAQIDASKRNNEITQGILNFLLAPLKAILTVIDKAKRALGMTSNLASGLTKSIANMFFDPEKTASDADKVIAEQKKALTKLENQRAGFLLTMQKMDEDRNNRASASRKERAENDLQFERELWDEKIKIQKEGYEKEKKLVKEEYKRRLEDLLANEKYTEDQKTKLKEQIEKTRDQDLKKLKADFDERDRELQSVINELSIQQIKEHTEREKAELQARYDEQLHQLEINEEYNEEQKTRLRELYTNERNEALRIIELSANERRLQDQLTFNKKELIENETNEKNKFEKFRELKEEQYALERDLELQNAELTANDKLLIEAEYQQKLRDLDQETREYKEDQDDKERERLVQKIEAIQEGIALVSETVEFANELEVRSIEKRYDAELENAQGNAELTAEIEKKKVEELNKVNKRAFIIKKTADIASATLDGYKAVLTAYASAPPPLNFVLAGIAGGFSALQIAKIASTEFEGATFDETSASAGGAGGAGGGVISPEFNIVGDSGINQLQGANQQPIEAYVVSQNVTTAQMLDNNIIQNATI